MFQLRFRREMLLLASHHDPGSDWRPELRRMDDLLVVRKRLLPATQSRRTQKVHLHLQQGILLRQARELTAAGQPMDTVPPTLTEDQIRGAIRAIDDMIASMRRSLHIADEDADQITAVNAHRRKTEADGVLHLLSRVSHPDALAGARRLRRDLNRLDDLAIRSASLAASIGETELAKHLVDKIPQSRTWPSYLKHLVVRLRSIEP